MTRDWRDAAEHRERRLALESIGVLASAHEELGRDVDPDAKLLEQLGLGLADELFDQLVELARLVGECLVAPSQALVAQSGRR